MTVKIELGFTADGQGGPFFTLDDPVLGRLDDPNVFLGGGEVFVDVSELFQTYSLTRGKSRELEKFDAGQASVSFENNQRTFDPTYSDSPYFGQIVPKRNLRITAGTTVQFLGVVEDWNIVYDPGGQSIATCQAFDSFSFLTNIQLENISLTEEDTDSRINSVLDAIGWSTAARQIGEGGAILSGTAILDPVPALAHLQTVANSDPGDLFIAKNGDVKFAGRNTTFTSAGLIFNDTGTGIPYKTISAIYGSELLYNNAIVISGVGTASAINSSSLIAFGERDLVRETFLNDVGQLQQLAEFLVNRYGQPEFRFEGITVDLRAITPEQKAQVLNLELADVVKVEFTPNKIGDAIERYGKVIGIVQNTSPGSEEVVLKLETTEGSLFVLDDPVFGKLDSGNLLGW
jgi:hypothetical protein